MDIPPNAAILAKEPLEGSTPAGIRQWLCENKTEYDLATALAQVHNKTGWLGHDLDEIDEPELSKAQAIYNEWWTLEKELYDKVVGILKSENATGKANHNIAVEGLYNIVKPFMERNAYSDGAGWWVK